MQPPTWFTQLKWSSPVHVTALNLNRNQIPDFTGCYAVSIGLVPISPGRILYIGEAAGQSLRKRIATYLVDFKAKSGTKTPKGKSHKGKGFILEARNDFSDAGVYIRWVEYGGNESAIHILEASLINYLNPSANDRVESERHPLLGDKEKLDRRLIR